MRAWPDATYWRRREDSKRTDYQRETLPPLKGVVRSVIWNEQLDKGGFVWRDKTGWLSF